MKGNFLIFCFCIFQILVGSINNCFSQEIDSLVIKNITARNDGYSIVISPEFFEKKNDTEIASLYSGLIAIGPQKENWLPAIVDENDYSLSNIIRNNFRVYFNGVEGYNKTYKVLENSIVAGNNMKDKDKLKVGDTILLPLVPVKPAPIKRKDYMTQFFLFQNDSVYKTLDTITNGLKHNGYNFKEFLPSEATYVNNIWTGVESNDKAEILNHTTFENISLQDKMKYFFIRDDSNTPDSLKILEIEFSDEPRSVNSAFSFLDQFNAFSSETKLKISGIEDKHIGEYLIMDDFKSNSNSCTHGDQVFSVSEEILRNLNATTMVNKIKKVPLNFFSDRDAALKNVNDYFNLPNRDIDEPYKNADMKFLRRIKIGKCSKFCVPEMYLRYLIELNIYKEPDVISMSFSFKPRVPSFGFLVTNIPNTSLVAAVQNDKYPIENYLRDGGLGDNKKEPMFTFSDREDKVLVGGRGNDGDYNCFYSENGDKVSAIGHGEWSFENKCVPQIYGSSFATPQIATYLWLMKSYFKSIDKKLSPLDSKLRLLLSADLDDNFVGKFASGGIPNLNEMLIDYDSYAIIDDEAFEIEIKNSFGTNLKYKSKIGFDINLNFSKLADQGFNGIVYSNDKIYLFRKSNLKWEAIRLDKIEFIDIEIELDSGEKIKLKSIDDLKTRNIKKLVTFK